MDSTGLLTDHYELTMLEASLRSGTADRRSVFELFGEKICRVVLSRDERGEIDDFVEFCAPHIVYAAAAIRKFAERQRSADDDKHPATQKETRP